MRNGIGSIPLVIFVAIIISLAGGVFVWRELSKNSSIQNKKGETAMKSNLTPQVVQENLSSTSSPTTTETSVLATTLPVVIKPTPAPKTVSTTAPSPAPASQSRNKKITSCNSIMGAGSYTMDKDLHATGNGCLDIQNVNDVAIDCGGYSIILDQQNKPNTEAIKPLLGFKNVKNFSLTSCNLKVVNPSFVPSTVVIENSSDGIISNTTFYDPTITSNGLDVFSITLDRTVRIKFSGNTVYGVYQQHYSNNNTIENNTFSPTLKTLKQTQVVVGMDYGSHNIVRNNIIDGKWNGSDPSLQIGADDGIELSDESYDTIQQNKIKNNWDCGIETEGLIQNSTISGNTILNSGVCGIGAWYYNSWKGNIIANNIVDGAPKLFDFFRDRGLQTNEQYVYFTDNDFRSNIFKNPSTGIESASFSFTAAPSRGLPMDVFILKNNRFSDNDFTLTQRSPIFVPAGMIVDGDGNRCANIPDPAYYPTPSDFPLKCN